MESDAKLDDENSSQRALTVKIERIKTLLLYSLINQASLSISASNRFLMKINYIVVFISSLTFFLGLYFFNFSNGLSNSHTKWGEFGSYLSGTVGVCLTAASIVFVYLTAKKQLDEQRKVEEIKRLEEKSQSILNITLSLMNSSHSQIPIINRLLDDLDWNKNDRQINESKDYNLIHITNTKTNQTLTITSFGKPFEILKSYISKTGEEKARKAIIDDDIGGLKNEFDTFIASSSYLIEILIKLINYGYDFFLIRHTASTIYNQIALLNSVNYIDKSLFERIGFILSLPTQAQDTVKIDIIKELSDELKRKHGVEIKRDNLKILEPLRSTESGLYAFRLVEKSTDREFYRATNGNWSINGNSI
ncbi:hypothetical protein ACJJIU_10315 [Microbulbifer sp. CnH-101-E]|uniref:hypothetical protein n=1 Tax=unclassified Microbulbifer TaxID=2619833 RepID=UPI00403A4339